MKTLFEFQQAAITKISKRITASMYVNNIKEYAESSNQASAQDLISPDSNMYRVQLKAPTGSGKTVMLAHLVREHLEDFVVFVMSPGAGELEEQTANRMSEILGGTVTRIDDSTFSQSAARGSVYVGNWEQFVARNNKTGDYKNKIMRDGDQRNFLDWVSQIGDSYTPVAFIIDEAHHGDQKTAGAIQSFMNDLTTKLGYPPFYIEASATPLEKIGGHAYKIDVPLKDVQKAGLVRKNVRLNNAALTERVNRMSADRRTNTPHEQLLIDAAIAQQNEIDQAYIRHDAHEMIDGKKIYYHSLIGLQLPNGKDGNEAQVRVESYLRDKYGITRDNGKLVVFLNNDKSGGLTSIASPDSPAQFLIYKQGIATGWDCPRAQILVGFRHITSKIFTKQNLGRFVRTTQVKHYDDDLLDYAYVFSMVGDLGQQNFGDDVDTDWDYESESVLRVGEDGHIALSSFNDYSISQSHFKSPDRRTLDPRELAILFAEEATKAELWKFLPITPRTELEGMKFVSGEIDYSTSSANGSLTYSKVIAEDDTKQRLNMINKIEKAVRDGGFDYEDSARAAQYITNQVVRWYREAVLNKPGRMAHFGKLAENMLPEIQNRLNDRNATLLQAEEIAWSDVAVEQISLDSSHFIAVMMVIQRTLSRLTSGVLKEKGNIEPVWKHRLRVEDPVFKMNIVQPIRTSTMPEHRLRAPIADHYAYEMPEGAVQKGSYHDSAALSGPEDKFEKELVAAFIQSDSADKQLAYFFKSPENRTGSFRVAVETRDKQQSDFYPDYLLEFVLNGKYTPTIVEVKAESDVMSKDPILLQKAKYLFELEQKENVRGGLVFRSDSENVWKVVSFDKDGNLFFQNALKYFVS